jgi:carboxylate-amine ligase
MGDQQRLSADELITRAREQFESAPDFPVAVEVEFAILDPESLDLTNRFEDLQAAARGTALEEHLVGELIASEVEVRTGKQASFADVPAVIAERRAQLRALVEPMGLLIGATGTHPWADWKEQRIIDTPHYRRNDELLRYVVWRNNTFGLHVHVAINGPDRAIAVMAGLRNFPARAPRPVRELAVRREREQRPPFGPHADLHALLPALRRPRRLRLVGRV